jgi:hypothetical protein
MKNFTIVQFDRRENRKFLLYKNELSQFTLMENKEGFNEGKPNEMKIEFLLIKNPQLMNKFD